MIRAAEAGQLRTMKGDISGRVSQMPETLMSSHETHKIFPAGVDGRISMISKRCSSCSATSKSDRSQA